MMQPADFGNGDNPAGIGSLNRAGFGWVLPERQMRPRSVVVRHIAPNDPQQMALVECDHVVEAFLS